MNTSLYVPLSDIQIPLSDDFAMVTPEFDFTRKRAIRTLNPDSSPFAHDDCYVFCSPEEFGEGRKIREVATLSHDGLTLNVSTTAPSTHVYTGKWNIPYKDYKHGPYSGIAFEPVRYLDAINWPAWRELSILKPGQEYYQETHYSVGQATD